MDWCVGPVRYHPTKSLLFSFQPRILMAMARDGLLPPFFSEISKSTSVPVNGTILSGCVASLMAFAMDLDQLSGMV